MLWSSNSMNKIPVVLLLFSILVASASAQHAGYAHDLTPVALVKENSVADELLSKQLQDELSRIEESDSRIQKFLTVQYENRTKYFRESISDGEFLFDSEVYTYVNKVFQSI